jgi:hypothetical protein
MRVASSSVCAAAFVSAWHAATQVRWQLRRPKHLCNLVEQRLFTPPPQGSCRTLQSLQLFQACALSCARSVPSSCCLICANGNQEALRRPIPSRLQSDYGTVSPLQSAKVQVSICQRDGERTFGNPSKYSIFHPQISGTSNCTAS